MRRRFPVTLKSPSDLGRRAVRPEAERPRVIVCGTRTFWDPPLLKRKLDALLKNLKDPIVLSGAAEGADKLAEAWALGRFLTVMRFHPEKERYGVPACFFARNREMAEYAAARRPSFCIAFWDGRSKGTADMIRRAKKKGLVVRVIYYKKERS
jgi:hypothetical protein